VEDADIRNYIKGYFLRQIPMNPDDPESEKRFDSLVDTVMQNKEQVQKINDELYTGKLLEVLKATLPVGEKTISYEEFVTLASAKHEHEHNHEHESEPDHDHGHDHDDTHDHGRLSDPDHKHEH